MSSGFFTRRSLLSCRPTCEPKKRGLKGCSINWTAKLRTAQGSIASIAVTLSFTPSFETRSHPIRRGPAAAGSRTGCANCSRGGNLWRTSGFQVDKFRVLESARPVPDFVLSADAALSPSPAKADARDTLISVSAHPNECARNQPSSLPGISLSRIPKASSGKGPRSGSCRIWVHLPHRHRGRTRTPGLRSRHN